MSKAFDRDKLKALVERVERLEAEKAELASDISEVFKEAKEAGFSTKVMRKVIALRKMDSTERDEQESLLELYKEALGLTPLERAAAE
jgi:uncharacterized protein (UPF0335 family)